MLVIHSGKSLLLCCSWSFSKSICVRVNDIATLSNDSKCLLISASNDRTIRLWVTPNEPNCLTSTLSLLLLSDENLCYEIPLDFTFIQLFRQPSGHCFSFFQSQWTISAFGGTILTMLLASLRRPTLLLHFLLLVDLPTDKSLCGLWRLIVVLVCLALLFVSHQGVWEIWAACCSVFRGVCVCLQRFGLLLLIRVKHICIEVHLLQCFNSHDFLAEEGRHQIASIIR